MNKVSPGFMVYKNPFGHGGIGVGADPGIHITWPICKLFGSIPGLIAIIAATVVLNLPANRNKVSPALIV